MYNAPAISDFQNYFIRDFPYGTDPNVAVLNQDILNAFAMVEITINQSLWPNQSAYTIGYLQLAAHFLVLNLRNASQGLNGEYSWSKNSRAVGSVSSSSEIPQRLRDNPDFMAYTKTNYGAAYLNLLWPYLAGQMFVVYGRTKP